METRTVTIRGNYDTDKETTIRIKTGKLLGPVMSKRAYQAAIKRMGLIEGDYPRLADDFPAIVVKDRFDNDFTMIQ
jgi:hypothetical protein